MEIALYLGLDPWNGDFYREEAVEGMLGPGPRNKKGGAGYTGRQKRVNRRMRIADSEEIPRPDSMVVWVKGGLDCGVGIQV